MTNTEMRRMELLNSVTDMHQDAPLDQIVTLGKMHLIEAYIDQLKIDLDKLLETETIEELEEVILDEG